MVHRTFAALLGAIALTACTQQQATQTQQQVSTGAAKSVSAMNKALTSPEMKDARLKVRVAAAITGQAGINVFHISTDVHNGVVTLNGTVPSASVGQTVVSTVRSVSGVKSVINHLTVKG